MGGWAQAHIHKIPPSVSIYFKHSNIAGHLYSTASFRLQIQDSWLHKGFQHVSFDRVWNTIEWDMLKPFVQSWILRNAARTKRPVDKFIRDWWKSPTHSCAGYCTYPLVSRSKILSHQFKWATYHRITLQSVTMTPALWLRYQAVLATQNVYMPPAILQWKKDKKTETQTGVIHTFFTELAHCNKIHTNVYMVLQPHKLLVCVESYSLISKVCTLSKVHAP